MAELYQQFLYGNGMLKNGYSSIAGTETTQMLSKQNNSTQVTLHLSSQIMPPELAGQNSVYGGILQVYGNVNRTARKEVIHSKSSSLHFA